MKNAHAGGIVTVGWTATEMNEIDLDRLRRRIERIQQLIDEGGAIDGAHHKQFFLAQIAAEVGVILSDQGIAP